MYSGACVRNSLLSPANQKGYVVLYGLAFFSLAICILFFEIFLSLLPEVKQEHLYIIGVSLAFTVAILAVEWRLDSYDCRRFLGAIFLITATVLLLILFYGEGWPIYLTGSSLFYLISGILLLKSGYSSQIPNEREEVLNLLRMHFEDTRIFEKDGVQFVLQAAMVTDTEAEIQVYLQNCFYEERTVTILTRDAAWFSSNYMPRFHKSVQVTLSPLEVMLVRLPVVSPITGQSFDLAINLACSRPKGKRMRLWRGTAVSSENSSLTRILQLAVSPMSAFFPHDKETTIAFKKSFKRSEQEPLPHFETETLWLPGEAAELGKTNQ